MSERIKALEEIVEDLDASIDGAAPDSPARAYYEERRAEVFVQLQGERGAAGLNPDTGEPA